MGDVGIVRHDLAAEKPDQPPKDDGLPRRVVLVPGVLALLPEYAGLVDPVAELRAACLAAVSWLAEAGPVAVIADPQGRRVAEHLLAARTSTSSTSSTSSTGATGATGSIGEGGSSYLVVANGSARRSEKAPGHLDERSFAFDETVEKALRTPDPLCLAETDVALAEELLAGHVAPGCGRWAGCLTTGHAATVDYADDLYGVQYWVMRWAGPQPEEGPCVS